MVSVAQFDTFRTDGRLCSVVVLLEYLAPPKPAASADAVTARAPVKHTNSRPVQSGALVSLGARGLFDVAGMQPTRDRLGD